MGDCCSIDHGFAVSLMHRLKADGQERLVFVDQRCLRVVFPGFKSSSRGVLPTQLPFTWIPQMNFISSFQSCHNLEKISGICDGLWRCWDNAGTWWELQVCLVYKMHLSSVILFVSMRRWSESHFINSLTNFIELPSPPCSHPETICSKNILLTRILTPCFFLKKKGGQIWLCWYWFRGGPGKFYESSARAPGPGNCVPERNETSGERGECSVG